MQAPGSRCRQVDKIRNRPRPSLLGEPDQRNQDLCRGRGVGESTMTGRHSRSEEVRERGESEARRSPAEQPPGEPHRVDDGSGHPPPRQPLDGEIEKSHVEAGVVCDEHRFARKREETPDREVSHRRSPHFSPADAGESGDRRRQRYARVDERLEARAGLQRLHPLGTDFDDARPGGREPRRLEVEDDERRHLELGRRAWALGQPDVGAPPCEASVTRDHIVEQRACDRSGCRGEGIEGSRGLTCRHRPASYLDEIDQPVGGIEGELHPGSVHEQTFVSSGKRKALCRAILFDSTKAHRRAS